MSIVLKKEELKKIKKYTDIGRHSLSNDFLIKIKI